MQPRPAYVTMVVFTLATLALLVAGCGGASPSAGVASLGSSSTVGTTTTQNGAASGPSGSASSGSGGGFGMTMKMQNGVKFAACKRAHGMPNFPDPNSQGAIQIGSSSGIDPNSPKFQAAQQACQTVLPNGGHATPAQVAQAQQHALAFSACMRRHELPDFPDPTFSGGGVGLRIKIGGGPGSDLNPNSATFKAAQKACQGNLPGAVGGGPGGK